MGESKLIDNFGPILDSFNLKVKNKGFFIINTFNSSIGENILFIPF